MIAVQARDFIDEICVEFVSSFQHADSHQWFAAETVENVFGDTFNPISGTKECLCFTVGVTLHQVEHQYLS